MDLEQETSQIIQKIPGKIIGVFKTSLKSEYQVEELPIDLNTNLTDKDLSSMIKQIIESEQGTELDETVSFEFLIGNEMLKGNIKSYFPH